MSFFYRFVRLLNSLEEVQNDEKVRFGMAGEKEAEKIIGKEDGIIIYNPIIPHPKDKNKFLETDLIVYYEGNLYCVEIKNLKGKIYFIPIYDRVEEVRRFLFLFKIKVMKKVQVGWDDSKIIQEKSGNHGEGNFYKEYNNPMKKTKYYIYNLKMFLSTKQNGFQNTYIRPVVAFNRTNTNISKIHSLESGYIYIDELMDFIKITKRKSENSKKIEESLMELSTWDTIITTSGERIYGIIKGKSITLNSLNDETVEVHYDYIKCINFKRGLFSNEDIVSVTFHNDVTEKYKCILKTVHLQKFDQNLDFKTVNLNKIEVGTWKLRRDNLL